MPTQRPASTGALIAAVGLSLLILLIWALGLSLLSDLRGSDAAGNAIAQAYAAFAMIAVWLLLAVLGLVAAVKGNYPAAAGIAALVLYLASALASMAALDLLSHPEVTPFLWPLTVPALAPPLIIAFCFWTLLPGLQAVLPARFAATAILGALFVVCIAIVPMMWLRAAAVEKVVAQRAQHARDFARIPADSPLWDWVPFLATSDPSRVDKTLERVRQLERRQADAELMLARGDFPLGFLGRFDLDPTRALCEKARGLLRRRVAPLVLKTPESKPYSEIADQVADAVAAMTWLVDYDCSVDAESLAWESMAKAYRDPSYDIYELARLRDPKRLGRALNENPEHFAMLTPKAHLKAWLKFTDDKAVREQALAGARALDHRTGDAVEILQTDTFESRVLLEYLPALELEATPALCAAALASLHGQFAKIYRPPAGDARSYDELLGRLGRGQQFSALLWLAEHGCDAKAELSEALSLINAYQPSPDSGLMAGRLEMLQRKP
ncbi:MAG TPA: hypothetical protein VG986_01030 [Pseudolabrys sp.]|nr:hypothetical protein [Pseudolabrys sp.]